MNIPHHLRIGSRTVLAMTCLGCRALLPGSAFDRHKRQPHEPPYTRRKCKRCRWSRMEESLGRNDDYR